MTTCNQLIGKPQGNKLSYKGQSLTLREWAAKKGIQLSTRGRIPSDVVEKYKAARK